MNLTSPIEVRGRCPHCRGTGTAASWARPDLGASYTDSEACGRCVGGEAVTYRCPATCLLAEPCGQPLALAGGFQGPVYYVDVYGCADGHRWQRTRDANGERIWLRDADVAALAVDVAHAWTALEASR